MARGRTLEQLLADLRVESRIDDGVAVGQASVPYFKALLARTQRWLYDDFDWPHMRRDFLIPLKAGQRYYSLPDGLNFERIQQTNVKWGEVWTPVERGIGVDHYSVHDPEGVAAVGSLTIASGTYDPAVGGFTVTAGNGTGVISNVAVNGVNLLAANVSFTTSAAYTAQLAAQAVNNNTTSSGYTANWSGSSVNLIADPDDGDSVNGHVVAVTTSGNVTVDSLVNMAGGSDNRITDIKVDGVSLITAPIGMRANTSAMADAVAAAINATEVNPEYTATAAGNLVNISADTDLGADANDLVVNVTTEGAVNVTAVTNMTGGVTPERADPVCAWDIRDVNGTVMIEVWPTPVSDDQTLRFNGIRALNPLAAESDTCDIESDLIVLYASGEILAGNGQKDAEVKLKLARARYDTIKGRSSKSNGNVFSLAGGGGRAPATRGNAPRVAYVRDPT